jgi:quercetin dioxygenase-like cupin family protein
MARAETHQHAAPIGERHATSGASRATGPRRGARYAAAVEAPTILDAQVVLPCADLGPTLAFFVDRLGFRVESIWPADDPRQAVLGGHGLRVALEPGSGSPGVLRLRATGTLDATVLTAPNGTRVEVVDADPPVVVPPLRSELVVSRAAAGARWGVGRAGMQYRDLLPGRLGGRFIASHIRIPDGGPVPDYVHFHKIRFQLIYCRRGWVRVVYEDQGEPFVMHAGDCVLQPPRIRHRVLEASDGLEVVELGCPAEHETHADPAIELPTSTVDAVRDFGGQRFVRHVAAGAPWGRWHVDGYECRDTGIADATAGLAGVRVVRRRGPLAAGRAVAHTGELCFLFILAGAMTVRSPDAAPITLAADDAIAVPAGWPHTYDDVSDDLELLEVTLPAEPGW